MLVWATTLFLLGVTAFLDSLFAFGEIFRRVNTVMFMLVSLGLLFEIRHIRKQAKRNQGETNQMAPPSPRETQVEPKAKYPESARVR